MKNHFLAALLFITMAALAQQPDTGLKEKAKKEIVKTEAAFRDLLKAKGAAEAFSWYAAPDAVIKRENDSLVKGRDAILSYYSKDSFKKAEVDWKPDFVAVSDDATLAFSYGRYQWKTIDSEGKEKVYSGVYNTVWKKMPDGSWKYIWD